MNPVRLEMMGSVRWCESGGAAGGEATFYKVRTGEAGGSAQGQGLHSASCFIR